VKLLAYHIENNKLRTVRIASVEIESPTVRTFTFGDERCKTGEPGQFLMIWIPGVDEIPLSILDVKEGYSVSVAVKNVGQATDALHRKKINDIIGVRGPFGNSFTQRKGRVLMVSGGTGAAPIVFLAKKLASRVSRLVFVIGAETGDEIPFKNRIEKELLGESVQLIVTTEDGSLGVKGLATDPLKALLSEEKFDMIYTCGPEQMTRKVFDLAEEHDVALEASLERLMRCAIGLCGSCLLGKYRVCRDGPVFTADKLREVRNEFGILKRDLYGRKISIDTNVHH